MVLKADTGSTTSAANTKVDDERFETGAIWQAGGRSQDELDVPQMSHVKAFNPLAAQARRLAFSPG